MELSGRALDATSNSRLFEHTTARGCGGLVGMDGLKVGEVPIWEDGMVGTVGVTFGITGGWFGWVEKEQMPLLAGWGQFVIGTMLRHSWKGEEVAMPNF